eukprot:1161053-Pelagomonas_calceolata.AAC.7
MHSCLASFRDVLNDQLCACQSPLKHTQAPLKHMLLVSLLGHAGELKLRDLMFAVRECLHADPQMAYHLWVIMFPIVWSTMEKNQQVGVAAMKSKHSELLQEEHDTASCAG